VRLTTCTLRRENESRPLNLHAILIFETAIIAKAPPP
jgi:hypothetical protein